MQARLWLRAYVFAFDRPMQLHVDLTPRDLSAGALLAASQPLAASLALALLALLLRQLPGHRLLPSGNLHAAADAAFLLSLALVAASVALNGYGAMAAKRRQGGGGATAEGAATGVWEVRLAAAHPVHDPTMAGERLAQVALQPAPGKVPDPPWEGGMHAAGALKNGNCAGNREPNLFQPKATLEPTSNLKWVPLLCPCRVGGVAGGRQGGRRGAHREPRGGAGDTFSGGSKAGRQPLRPVRYTARYQVSSTFYSTYSFQGLMACVKHPFGSFVLLAPPAAPCHATSPRRSMSSV